MIKKIRKDVCIMRMHVLRDGKQMGDLPKKFSDPNIFFPNSNGPHVLT